MISEDRWVYFCKVDFIHKNLDTTLKAMKFDELQTRIWFLNGAGTWATVGNDFVVRIWKLLEDGELGRIHEINDHTDIVTQITFASKTSCLISSSLDGSLRMWSAVNYRLKFSVGLTEGGNQNKIGKAILTSKNKEKNLEGVRGKIF